MNHLSHHHLRHRSSRPSSSQASIVSGVVHLRCNNLRHLSVIELNVFDFCVKSQLWKWLQNQVLHPRHSIIQMCLMWIWNHTVIGVWTFEETRDYRECKRGERRRRRRKQRWILFLSVLTDHIVLSFFASLIQSPIKKKNSFDISLCYWLIRL